MVFFERTFIALRYWLIKLGLAVWLSLVISRWLGITDLLSPAFTALLCIRGTFFTGLSVSLSQVSAALAGTAISLAFTAILGGHDVALAFSVMLGAYLCLKLHWEVHSPLVLFTLLYTHLLPMGTLTETAIIRIQAVMVGVAVATAINFLFSKFRYRRMYYYRLRHALERLEASLNQVKQAAEQGDANLMKSHADGLKSLARLVSLLYEESLDLRRETRFRRAPGNLEEPLVPRIEFLAGLLESACWHLFGVIGALMDILEEEDGRIPGPAIEQLTEAVSMARHAVTSFGSLKPSLEGLETPLVERKLPFFGMPVPEVTLLAELALLMTDLEQIQAQSARFVIELHAQPD